MWPYYERSRQSDMVHVQLKSMVGLKYESKTASVSEEKTCCGLLIRDM